MKFRNIVRLIALTIGTMLVKRLQAVIVILLLALASSVVIAAPASATHYTNYCSSNFSVLDTHNVLDQYGNINGKHRDYYWSAGGGTNCAINFAYGAYHGVYMWRSVCIRESGTTFWTCDKGNYRYYAGPVAVTGLAGKCIDIYSAIGTDSAHPENFGKLRLNGIHCG